MSLGPARTSLPRRTTKFAGQRFQGASAPACQGWRSTSFQRYNTEDKQVRVPIQTEEDTTDGRCKRTVRD